MRFGADDVNEAIEEATKTEMPRDVIRWNAKRELLDRIQNYIIDTRKERDRIETDERTAAEPDGMDRVTYPW